MKLDSSRTTNTRKVTLLGMFMLLALLLQACGGGQSLTVGDPAPEFSLPTASGSQVSLAAYQEQQPVLLYFHMALG